MLSKLRPRSVYDLMAAIACVGVLAGGTAYAADTIGSADVIDESLLSQDIKNGQITRADVGNNAAATAEVLDGSLTGIDVQDGSLPGIEVQDNTLTSGDIFNGTLTGVDVLDNGLTGSDVTAITGSDVSDNTLTGSDIAESSLSVPSMRCQNGLVWGGARIRGDSDMPSTYSSSLADVDRITNCAGGNVQVRRGGTGVYFVRFQFMPPARVAVAVSNADLVSTNSTAVDNIIAISWIGTTGTDQNSYRIEVSDVTGDGVDPQDDWVNLVLV